MPLGFSSWSNSARPVMVLALGFVISVFSLAQAAPEAPNSPILTVAVDNAAGNPGQQNVVLSVNLANIQDSISAFTLWLKLNRPEAMRFKIDTVIIVGNPAVVGFLDTSNTMMKGWEYLDTRSMSGNGTDLLITGIANANGGPSAVKLPLGPQAGGTMFRVYCNVTNIPDSMTERSVIIQIEKYFLDKFVFSRPDGSAIGFYNVIRPDTQCWRCDLWNPPGTCNGWTKVPEPPCDEVRIVPDTVPKLDTSKVWAFDGELVIGPGCCVGTTGNVNMTGIVDLSDLSSLVSYLTGGGYVLPCVKEANVNAAGIVDLSDLSALVSYLTGGGYILPGCP